jgi:hypothetical protein
MKLHSAIANACLLISIVCLALGYTLAGYWPILFAIAAMLLLWSARKKEATFWAASSLLAVYVLLAMMGIILKAQLPLMVTGCVSALVWWDLSDFRESLAGEDSARTAATLEKQRLQLLALTSAISLGLAAMGPWLRMQLPFGVIVLLVMVATGCILYSVHRLRHPGMPS